MIPIIAPVKVAPDTYLIPNLAVPVSSLVILGEEPIIVDTGAPAQRGRWLEMVYSLVDPDDIRWVFISHEGDHTGSLDQVLDAAPQATLVINMFSTERLALERPVHLERMIWREPGETFDALTTGVRPPCGGPAKGPRRRVVHVLQQPHLAVAAIPRPRFATTATPSLSRR